MALSGMLCLLGLLRLWSGMLVVESAAEGRCGCVEQVPPKAAAEGGCVPKTAGGTAAGGGGGGAAAHEALRAAARAADGPRCCQAGIPGEEHSHPPPVQTDRPATAEAAARHVFDPDPLAGRWCASCSAFVTVSTGISAANPTGTTNSTDVGTAAGPCEHAATHQVNSE